MEDESSQAVSRLSLSSFDNRPQVKKKKLNILPPNPEILQEHRAVGPGRFPSWLHRKLPKGNALWQTDKILSSNRLHTVCEEAQCPNLLECWTKKTATFLVLGKACTRNCGFCDIDFTKEPKPPEDDEPIRVADSVRQLGLKHVVITMVARDDLPDGGAAHIAAVVDAVKEQCPQVTTEVLTSDFFSSEASLNTVLASKPDIFNHNIETVRELTPRVRHTATYDRTLEVIRYVKSQGHPLVKSGMMVGLGETEEQVQTTISDLHAAGCDIITMGQYLQPNRHKLRVKAFVTPDEFKAYEEYGYSIGIKNMYCGPFVRSSYNANLVIQQAHKNITLNSH